MFELNKCFNAESYPRRNTANKMARFEHKLVAKQPTIALFDEEMEIRHLLALLMYSPLSILQTRGGELNISQKMSTGESEKREKKDNFTVPGS